MLRFTQRLSLTHYYRNLATSDCTLMRDLRLYTLHYRNAMNQH